MPGRNPFDQIEQSVMDGERKREIFDISTKQLMAGPSSS
jgi:hypothetical protein